MTTLRATTTLLGVTMLTLSLLACGGGQSSTARSSTESESTESESADGTEAESSGPRPIRIESSDHADTTETAVPSSGVAPLTTGELADPPPVEPP